MNTLILSAQATQSGGADFTFLIMMVAIFAIMWFFMIRPQQKKQKEIRNFQNSLTEGTPVVVGGIHGTVKRIDMQNGTVEVEIAKGVNVTVDRTYVFGNSAATQPTQAQ